VTGNVKRWRNGEMILAGPRTGCWRRRSSSGAWTA